MNSLALGRSSHANYPLADGPNTLWKDPNQILFLVILYVQSQVVKSILKAWSNGKRLLRISDTNAECWVRNIVEVNEANDRRTCV
jgi:hypothetical protein